MVGLLGVLSPPLATAQLLDDLIQHLAVYGVKSGVFLTFDSLGNTIEYRALGLPSRRRGFNWSLDTQSRLASVSKPITAHVVIDLIDRGLLTWNTKAIPFLGLTPASDSRVNDITVSHLVQHYSGWSSYEYDPCFDQFTVAAALGRPTPLTPNQIVRFGYTRVPVRSTPGTEYRYSNFGYSVLGAMIEKATGQSYAVVARNWLLSKGIGGLQVGRTLVPTAREATYSELSDRMFWSLFEPGMRVKPYAGGYALESMQAFG